MVNKIWLIILLCLGNCASAQKIKTLFEADALFGKVREVTTTNFRIFKDVEDTTIADSLLKIISTYDADGNILVSFFYMTSNDNNVKNLRFTKKFIYQPVRNKNGNISRVDSYEKGKQAATYKFNKNGYLIETSGYSADRQMSFKSLYAYDEDGNQVDMKYYDREARLLFERKYKYDNRGNALAYDDYRNGELTSSTIFKAENVDATGNWLKRIITTTVIGVSTIGTRIEERKIIYY